MELDKDIIRSIVAGNPQFLLPEDEPEPYYIWNEAGTGHTEPDEAHILLFYDKLRFAVRHSDELIQKAVREEFLGHYGVNRSKILGIEDMRSRMMFESFTMDAQKKTINTYLSNKDFMPGHYIEVYWTDGWEVEMYCIC